MGIFIVDEIRSLCTYHNLDPFFLFFDLLVPKVGITNLGHL
jgi:hypothetical protein